MPVIPDGFPNKEAIDAETLANAHLIAAAPEMLAALEMVADVLSDGYQDAMSKAVNAAIAKAKGGAA